MKYKILTRASAFSDGAQLWVVPDLNLSPWTRLLNWYLNLQISRFKAHKFNPYSQGLKQIVEKNELPFSQYEASTEAPLIISCQSRLPSDSCMEMPYRNDLATWLKDIQKVWVNLNYPTLRIFLPPKLSENELLTTWPKTDKDSEVSFVLGGPYE